jgi:hypothetical protein
VDSKNFPVSKNIAAALVTVKPGAFVSSTGIPMPRSGSSISLEKAA